MKFSLAMHTHYPSQASVLIDRIALAAVVILALFVRFYSIAVPAIWYDEAYSLLLARETPARIWALTALDVHPPLYYVLLHYWVVMWGDAALPARALSALADVGTLLLCVKLMSLISTRRAIWIAALLLALLPISVRYSQEVRMYTLLGFWLMGATVALVYWARAPDRKRFAVIYVLLMSAAFYTHYFAGLCVLVHWLFWWQSRTSLTHAAIAPQEWIVANVAIVFLYLPWLPHLISQLAYTDALGWIEPVTLQGALALVWQFTVMGGDYSTAWQLIPFAVMVLCVATVMVNRRDEKHFTVLLIAYFFAPLLILYLTALFLPLFVPRYLVFSAPGLVMVAAAALDIWFKRRPSLASVALLLVIVSQLHGLLMVYRQTDSLNGTGSRADSSFGLLVRALNQAVHPSDEVIIANVFWFPTFAYFSTTEIIPRYEIRSSMDGFLRLTSRGALSLIDDPVMNTYFDGVTDLNCRKTRIWWVTDHDWHADRPLFAKDRTPSQIIRGNNISAYLFTPESCRPQ